MVRIAFLLCLILITSMGCGRAYQSISADRLNEQLPQYEGQRISIVGVPAQPQPNDFLPPTPLHDGRWTFVINGLLLTETINFENEPRIRSIRQMAASARKENQPVKVSGVVKNGLLEMEYFNGIRTDTVWYKNKNPYYSYGEYYEWYPFAYRPNARALLRVLETK